MAPQKGSFSVVIRGRWNPHVFSVDWVKANLCNDPDSPVSLAVSLTDPDAPPRISFEDIVLFPNRSRLEIHAESATSEGICKCAAVARKSLELLMHTPVIAAGVNFGFSETCGQGRTATAIGYNDSQYIDSSKYELLSTDVARTFRINSDWVMTLNLSYKDDAFLIDFNYQYDSAITSKLVNALSDKQLRSFYEDTLDFIKTVYEIDDAGSSLG